MKIYIPERVRELPSCPFKRDSTKYPYVEEYTKLLSEYAPYVRALIASFLINSDMRRWQISLEAYREGYSHDNNDNLIKFSFFARPLVICFVGEVTRLDQNLSFYPYFIVDAGESHGIALRLAETLHQNFNGVDVRTNISVPRSSYHE